ncbi:MAG: presenilin family intramembrane aspartyl protease [Candidatus Aenigmatarchaeota archaeon]
MKHSLSVTLVIVLIFLLSQIIGLYALNNSIKITETPYGEIILEHEETVIGERPEIYGAETFVYILVAILAGTILILLLTRYEKPNIWKSMFFFAVWITSSITLGVFIDKYLALFVCFLLAFFKVWRPNIWIHNITELLIYAGIVIIFAPLIDLLWISLLLIAVSIYDIIAVWYSKHMISLAEFQTRTKAFAGFMLSYKMKSNEKSKRKELEEGYENREEVRNAILGGGDIAFPMLFAGVVMESMLMSGFIKPIAFLNALIIPIICTIVLFLLLFFAKKDKFYPAMPFLTTGCFIGYGIILALGMI